jgi:hypothetical protein
MSFDEFIGGMRNTELAKALELIAPRLDSELAQAIMQEAARRLRGEPEPHYASPPLPDIPPLKAQAAPRLAYWQTASHGRASRRFISDRRNAGRQVSGAPNPEHRP